jgi:hypothetical protein
MAKAYSLGAKSAPMIDPAMNIDQVAYQSGGLDKGTNGGAAALVNGRKALAGDP